MINEARGKFNKVIPRARGEAQQTILEAEGYSLNQVNRAEVKARAFAWPRRRIAAHPM